MLEVAELEAGYGDLRILRGVSLAVGRGERVLVFGPNGSGKSTLLKAISGILRPSAGSVRLAGSDVAGRPAHRIVRSGLSYVPQTGNIFPDLTVEENLEVGAATARRGYRERRDAAMDLFPTLAERRRQVAGTLSGGERQLVALGRALMLDPGVLLLDEPAAALSAAMAEQVFDHVLTVNRERGVAILLVEQNVLKALEIVQRGYLLETGTVRLAGPVGELRASEAVRGAYLGSSPDGPPTTP
ncbi:MAG: ATP-binding cassette domain-containing protein [Streptosporangiales bacterium]|nr:ATP-binding cassette domain-containing protein [Streptosporangiales bacterium]